MNLLQAVNLVLPKLGERPVTSLTQKHPTLAILLPIIEDNRRKTLARGWWFNEYDYTVPLTETSECEIGEDTLSFVPFMPDTAVARDTKLFNPKTNSYIFTAPVQGRVIQDVDFDLVPESAQRYVYYSSLCEAFVTDLGVTEDFKVWTSNAAQAWSDLIDEHVRQKKFNTKRLLQWRKLRRAMRA